jgi:hypothetical protein
VATSGLAFLDLHLTYGSGEIFMIGFLKTIFSGLFGIIGAILRLPLTLVTLPLKLLSSNKSKDASAAPAAKKKSGGAFYLEADDAKGFIEPAPKAAPQASAPASAKASVAATANALNLPQPTVTTSGSASPTEPTREPAYSQFGSRRGPGANMKSFLDMAKTVKRA